MIRRIVKLYIIIIFISINIIKIVQKDEESFELKLYNNRMIKIRDIIVFIQSKKEIKTLKFFIIFIFMYPSIFLLILSSVLTTYWTIYYYIKIKIFKLSNNYMPLEINKKKYEIHSYVTVIRILKILLIQIPQIRGFYNAYTLHKNINNPKKIKINEIVLVNLNNIKNILIMSISPLRLYFIIQLSLHTYRNVNERFYWYEFKKYTYGLIYGNNNDIIEKTKKMKIIKNSENIIIFNPTKKGTDVAMNGAVTLYSVTSKNGPHYLPQISKFDNKKSLGIQLTGKIPEKIKETADSIEIEAKNYKYNSMFAITNMMFKTNEIKSANNIKALWNAGLYDENAREILNALAIAKRLDNREYFIEHTFNGFIVHSLNGMNIYEHIIEKKENIDNMRNADSIINTYEKMTKKDREYLINEGKHGKILNFHNLDKNSELYTILIKNDLSNLF
jgi:hypothetical protein